jgi:hypothetical protein
MQSRASVTQMHASQHSNPHSLQGSRDMACEALLATLLVYLTKYRLLALDAHDA